MSKYEEYQQALNELKTVIHDEFDGTKLLNNYLEKIKTLQELVDLIEEYDVKPEELREVLLVGKILKYKPTLEEVKQEWEALGYEWRENKDSIDLLNRTKEEIIVIDKENKRFAKTDDRVKIPLFINWQEQKLLTKTFKALGWM